MPSERNLTTLPQRPTIPALEPKAIRNVAPDDAGYAVEFECGHSVWFAIEPATDRPHYSCSVCAHAFLRSLR